VRARLASASTATIDGDLSFDFIGLLSPTVFEAAAIASFRYKMKIVP
jgi:hypothetical protein